MLIISRLAIEAAYTLHVLYLDITVLKSFKLDIFQFDFTYSSISVSWIQQPSLSHSPRFLISNNKKNHHPRNQENFKYTYFMRVNWICTQKSRAEYYFSHYGFQDLPLRSSPSLTDPLLCLFYSVSRSKTPGERSWSSSKHRVFKGWFVQEEIEEKE